MVGNTATQSDPVRCLVNLRDTVTDRFCLQETKVVVPRIDEVVLVERVMFGCATLSSLLTSVGICTYKLQSTNN